MIKRRKIAPWGIPIIAAAFLAACAAVLPAAADPWAGLAPGGQGRPIGIEQDFSLISPWSKPIISPQTINHINNARIRPCFTSLSAMAEALEEAYNETPLVAVYRGGTEDKPHYVVTIFVNTEEGSWTITQSDNRQTCAMSDISAGHGGLIFDVNNLVENSRIRNIGTES